MMIIKTKGAFQKNTYGLMKKIGFKNVCTLMLQLCKAHAYLKNNVNYNCGYVRVAELNDAFFYMFF